MVACVLMLLAIVVVEPQAVAATVPRAAATYTAGGTAAVEFDWASPQTTALAIPTYLDQVNPSMDRESPMHDAVFSRIDKLGAKLVRYLHWSHSQAPFPELAEGVFNFTLTDQYVLDFMACKNAVGSVMNFDAAPCWLHEGHDCAKPLRDPTGVELGEWISRIISWYTKGGFTDKRTGKVYTSPHKLAWENYEVLNEPNLKRYLSTTPTAAAGGNTTNPICRGGCAMVTVLGGYYHGPSYVIQKTLLSQASCEAGCLANTECVQMTWAPKHAGSQCVFYDRIDKRIMKPKDNDPVVAKVKCDAHKKPSAPQCAPFSPGGGGAMVPNYVRYTQLYDGIVSVLSRDHPELNITALCLAQGGGKDSQGSNEAMIYDDDWFTYFFNASNHKLGIKPPAYVTYHFYAIPGAMPSFDPWKGLNAKTPIEQWPFHLFKQAEQFITRAAHVNELVAAGSFGGRAIKVNVDEVGIIGGSHCPVSTLFSSNRMYWNIAASLWGFYYGELARLGSTAIAASQLTGYPAGTWTIHGAPVANNFPCVSMMDWRGNGSDTARTWALQMTIDILGNDEKTVYPAKVSGGSSASAGGTAEAWPLPSTVYSIGFELGTHRGTHAVAATKTPHLGDSGKRVILLANTNTTSATVTVQGAAHGTVHTVDLEAGYGSVPYSTRTLESEEVTLGPSAFVLIELANHELAK